MVVYGIAKILDYKCEPGRLDVGGFSLCADELDDLYLRHDRVHLLFSGGKDSTLCLEKVIARGYGSNTVLVVVDTGAMADVVKAFIHDRYADCVAGIRVLTSSVRSWIRDNGFPVDFVNVDRTREGRLLLKNKRGIQVCSRQACCEANLWIPLRQFIASGEATAIIMGEKNSDPRGTMPSEWVEGGVRVEVFRPLAGMTDTEVRAELYNIFGDRYPKRFDCGASSIDCTCCTAYWDEYVGRAPYLDCETQQVVHAIMSDVAEDMDRAREVLNKNLGVL